MKVEVGIVVGKSGRKGNTSKVAMYDKTIKLHSQTDRESER